MFLLDTNVISELRRPERANPNVLTWAERANQDALFLCTTTVLELEYGALSLARRDPAAGGVLSRWIRHSVLTDFEHRILPATIEIALLCARLHVPIKRGERDAWIAATALSHGLTVVTRNVKDFEGTGAALINPWGSTL